MRSKTVTQSDPHSCAGQQRYCGGSRDNNSGKGVWMHKEQNMINNRGRRGSGNSHLDISGDGSNINKGSGRGHGGNIVGGVGEGGHRGSDNSSIHKSGNGGNFDGGSRRGHGGNMVGGAGEGGRRGSNNSNIQIGGNGGNFGRAAVNVTNLFNTEAAYMWTSIATFLVYCTLLILNNDTVLISHLKLVFGSMALVASLSIVIPSKLKHYALIIWAFLLILIIAHHMLKKSYQWIHYAAKQIIRRMMCMVQRPEQAQSQGLPV
ncbi:hypothetical protein Ancab_014376 [Ancistrocladus abbreviatus]